MAGAGVLAADAGRGDHHRGQVPGRRPELPVHRGLLLDPAVRRALRGRRGRYRAGAHRHVRGADAGGDPGLLARRGARTALREDVLRADDGARDDDDRRLRGHRRLPVLRVLRGHAGADVLHDRQLRRRQAAVRGGQVPALQPARRPAHAGRDHRAVRVLGGKRRHRAPRHVPVQRADPRVAEPDRAEVAVPRVLHRVRDQGAAVAVPHLAARRRRGVAARRGGTAGRRAGQGGHVRDAAVLLGAVPGRREVLHAAGHNAGRDRDLVRGHRRDRPAVHEAADRLHLDLALRLHRARHLRDDQPGRVRRDVLHGQPRVRHRRAVHLGRVPDRQAGDRPDRGLRRRAEGRSAARRAVPGLRPGGALAARSFHLHQRVPRPGWDLLPVQAARHRRHLRDHPGRDLHLVDVPADNDRAGPRRGGRDEGPATEGTVRGRAAGRAHHRGRRLPQAGARHHQPGGTKDDDAGARDRSGARPSRGRLYDDRCAEGNRTVIRVLADSTTGVIGAPHIEYGQLSPMLVVFTAAVVGVLVEAFLPRPVRRAVHLVLALGALTAAFILNIVVASNTTIFADGSPGHLAAMGAVGVDRPTLFIQGTIVVLAFVSLLLIGDTSNSPFAAQAAATPGSPEERESLAAGIMHTEIFPLTMFAVGGMMLFPASNDLLTMFVALEVLSLPLYLLCGLARRRRLLSHEAAMKYFLLGAFSSAFFLFGIAMLYGFSGSVSLAAIASAASSNTANLTLLFAGIALVGIGLLFKIGAVPFQGWKPDVYQGAPTPITALMASCVVVSAFGALLRVFYVAFGTVSWSWRPAFWVVAVLTMVVGAVIAITQTDVKRLLAYSSIAHAGFVLTAVIATSVAGLSSSLFYLATYGLTTVGAFAVITLVRDPGGEAGHLSRWAGLGRRSPLVAGTFALFLLAFAGIPLTSGFTGKFAVFQAALQGGA